MAATERAGRMNEHGLPLAFNKPSQLRPEALDKIKGELVHLGTNGSRSGFTFAEKMFELYPELRNL